MKTRNITQGELQKTLPPMPPSFEQATLHTLHNLTHTKEEPIMKKKLSLGLVLALILALALAAAAFAVSYWRDTVQGVATMQAEHGYFDTWAADERIALALMLHEKGAIEQDERLESLKDPTRSTDEKGAIATATLEDWTGGEAWAITLERVAERMNGSFASWTPEDKAWFTQMLDEAGLLSGEDILFAAPDKGDISQAEAIEAAKLALSAEYGLPDGYFDGFDVNPMFHVPTWEVDGVSPGEAIWAVELTHTEVEDGHEYFYLYAAELDRHGNLLGVGRNNPKSLSAAFDTLCQARGAFYQWTAEDQAAYSQELPDLVATRQAAGEEVDCYLLALSQVRFGFPAAGDIQRGEAIAHAIDAVKDRYGATDDGLSVLKAYASFDITDERNPIWRIKLLPFRVESYEGYESTGYVVHIGARDGEVLLTLSRNEDDIGAIELF